MGERGIRKSLDAERAKARKAASPEEAARNRLEGIASRDAESALKAPDDLITAAGEAIRPEFRLDFLLDRLKDESDMISVIARPDVLQVDRLRFLLLLAFICHS